MSKTKIKTKFGNATLCNDGYYHITSRKEGNNGKKVSRLVFEDFYNIKLPANIHIHHVDKDRTNDNIWNLIPMTCEEHTTLHNLEREMAEETMIKISATKSNTGFFRVCKTKDDECVAGYKWVYDYADANGDRKRLSSPKLDLLKSMVLDKGLKWFVTDEEMARITVEEAKEYYRIKKEKSITGIDRVTKQKDTTCKQGFIWQYRYLDENGKARFLCSVDLDRLKDRVLAKGLDWTVLDENRLEEVI